MPARPPTRLRACLRAAALGAALAAGAALPLQAQSLAELFDAARAYDAALLAARAQAEAAEHRQTQAAAALRPTLALQAQGTHGRREQPASSAAGGSGHGQIAAATLSARYPLFNRASEAGLAQAARAIEVARAELALAEQDLAVRLAQAYFDVLVAVETLATAQAASSAIAEQLAAARRAFEVGTATITDTREAQARFDLARAREIQADNDLRVRRIGLDQLVGRSGVQPWPLARPVVLPPTQPPGIDDWAGLAAQAHPQLRRARLALDIAGLEAERARAARLPTVDAIASLQHSRNFGSAGIGAALGPTEGGFSNGQIGVQLNWTLGSGGAIDGRIAETRALLERAGHELQGAQRSVVLSTRQAYTALRSGEAEVGALEAAEASSRLALEATQTGYRVGVRVNLDVLNAQSQLFATQRDLAAARYQVLLRSLRLRQAAGTLAADDLRALDRLLQRQ